MTMTIGAVSSSKSNAAAANSAVRFDASGDKYSRSATGIGTGPYTITAWVKPVVDRNAFGAYVGFDNGGSGYNYLGVNATGTTLGRFSNAGDYFAGTLPDMTLNTWYFVALPQAASATTVYWAAAGSSTVTAAGAGIAGACPIADSYTLNLGTDGFGDWVNGSLAAVKIWTATLTEAEINTELPFYAAQRTSGLWASYKFNSGPQTADDSGNGRTLTAAGTLTTDSSGPPIT